MQNEGGYLRALTIGGRSFVVEALFQRRPAPAAELATVNRILSSIRVAPSSPPVTEAAPVSFDPGAGITAWSAARRSPSSAWASSVTLDPRDLYQTGIDGTLVWSPAYTLAHLPSDGVVITAMRWRTHTPAIGPLSVDPTGHLSADLTTARPERHWEGRPAPDLVAYRIEGTLGPDLADVRVYLHAHPAPGTLRRAQAMLDRLRFAAPLKD